MPFFENETVRVFHRWENAADLQERPVLLLSHSLGATHEMWEPQLEAFSRYFRILRYDHRGHGQSSVPPGPYYIEDSGRDVLALLDSLELEHVHFCGLSLGGMTGMWLAQNAPERIDRLVLCNTTAKTENPELLDERMRLIAREGLAAIADGVLEKWFTPTFRESSPERMERTRRMVLATPDQGYVATSAAVCSLDLRPQLSSIAIPTMVICGCHDLATPPEMSQEMAKVIPNSQLVTLDAAHLSNIEASGDFNKAVLEFLS